MNRTGLDIRTFETTGKSRVCGRLLRCALLLAALILPAPLVALAAITSVTPSTWNIIGLDSNTPAFGPNRFPVGAQVCSNSAGAVTAQLHWDSGGTTNDDSVIKLRGGTSDTISLNFAAAGCLDAFFEVEVTKADTSFDQTRRYHITAGSLSTPTPRELKVEHLVSQSRNAITNMEFGTSLASLGSVPNGGSFSLIVGKTYYIRMSGYTATQGYEQLESFVNFPNTIFQVLSVNSTYSADTSPIVNSPNDKLYSDACGWDNDPNSPSYLSCYADGKAGGTVVVTYQVKILNVSSGREELNSLIHDFSGSSFHYNADYSTSARFANIVNPNDVTIAKNFAPTTVASGKTSTLTIAITNPTYGAIGGLAFTDTFPTSPGNMVVASTTNASTANCGTPTYSPAAGAGSISFSNGTVPALTTCLVKVDVTAPTQGTYNNTTGALSAEGNSTGKTASASLVIDDNAFPEPYPPQTCATRTTLATWGFDNLSTGANSSPAYSGTPHADVSSVAASCVGCTASNIVAAPADATANSWAAQGWQVTPTTVDSTTTPYYRFSLDASKFGNVRISWRGRRDTEWAGSNTVQTFTFIDNVLNQTATSTALVSNAFTNYTSTGANASNTAGNSTEFRLNAYYRNASKPNAQLFVDTVVIDGCAIVPTDPPNISKAFSPTIVAQGDTSTLTFTVTNPNVSPALALSGVTVTDSFPAGLTVAAPLTTTNTCNGSLVDDAGGALAAGDTGIRLTGGSIAAPAGSPRTCTFSVNVRTPAPDPDPTKNVTLTFENTSRAVAASESGANTDSTTGVAKATLKALAPPVIRKLFGIDPIFTSAFGGYSPITFTILNPNTADVMNSVAFSDTFPVAPGSMVVAPAPGATTSNCGTPSFTPVAGAGSIAFTGGTIAAGTTCSVTVNVTAPTAGIYTNTTGNVSHILNGYTANGNTNSDQLQVETAAPAIALLKQVGASSTGPWSSYLAVATGGNVYYRFTVENLGDVALSSVNVTDPAAWVNLASCSWSNGDGTPLTAPFNLPVAGASNAHLASCITATPATAVAGTHPNTATATGSFGATTVTDPSTATYATTAVTLDKTANKSYYMTVGEIITYSYAIQNANTGARLDGPLTVTVTDNKISSVTCPALSTVGNLNGNFDPGETLTCTASYTVTASDLLAEQIVNIARANIRDGASINVNTPQDSVTVLAGPDLVVTKANSVSGAASTNVPFTWTLTARNTTNLGMTASFTNGQRLLVDNLPAGPTYSVPAVATNTGLTTGTISCAIVANVLTCTATGNVAITPDGGFTIAITATPAATGTLANPTGGICRIDPDALIPEINDGNNDCSDTVTVSTPAITLIKSATESYFLAVGNTINYSYRVRNTGLVPQPGPVSVTDDKIVLPAIVSCPAVSTAIVYATGLAGNGDAILDQGEQVTCTSTYTVLAADVTAGSVTNTATATVGGINSPPASLTVPIGPDLGAVKTHPAIAPIPLVPFNWTLTVTNAPAAGYPANFANGQMLLQDDLPTGQTYGLAVATPATLNGTASGTINCIVAADILTCTASGAVSIPPGSGFSINVPTTALSGGTLTNPRGGGICRADPNTLITEISDANNDCSDSVLVGVPNITMLKSVTPAWDPVNGDAPAAKAIPGALMQYTFAVTNFGYGPTDAGTVFIVDAIPTNMEMFVSDFDGAGPVVGPVSFIDGPAGATTALSGLSYNFVALGDGTDKLSFSSDGTNFNYTPIPDGTTGCDPLVKKFKVTFGQPADIFAGTNGTKNPTFSLLFKARIK